MIKIKNIADRLKKEMAKKLAKRSAFDPEEEEVKDFERRFGEIIRKSRRSYSADSSFKSPKRKYSEMSPEQKKKAEEKSEALRKEFPLSKYK